MHYPTPSTPSGVDETAWAAAVADVRAYCGWHIGPEVTETVVVDGSGTAVQLLPTLRLVDLISITNDGAAVTDPEWSAAGIVRGSWTHKYRGVTAEMTHGYEMWPEDLERLTVSLTAGSSLAGVKAVTSGSHQVSFETSLTPMQRSTLDRYRLVTLR